jgi:hypothetical protein
MPVTVPAVGRALAPLSAAYAETRAALHALAEQVLAAARYRATGHISLAATPGGFGTPAFGDGESVRVDGVELVHTKAGSERRTRITTIAAAAEFVGVVAGAPPVYTAATSIAIGEPLAIDVAAAGVVASWYALGDAVLRGLKARYPGVDATEPQLWPEHFDLAIELGDSDAGTRANYGASPGDTTIGEPYLYVGPWDARRRTGQFAAQPFGAACGYDDVRADPDPDAAAAAFVATCAEQLLGTGE